MENSNMSVISNAPSENRRTSLTGERERNDISAILQGNTESSSETPSREVLRTLTKAELQKRCRLLKLNSIWVKKEELIDMILDHAGNNVNTNEVYDSLTPVQTDYKLNEQYLRQFIKETKTCFETVNKQLVEKNEQINELRNKLVAAENKIERLQEQIDSSTINPPNAQSCSEVKTLILGDSTLKEIKFSDLAENCRIRTIPGANMDLLKCWVTEKLEYNVKECIIYCGAQDLQESSSKVENILDNLGTLVAELKTKNENISVKICELIPCSNSTDMANRTENFNLRLIEWCVNNGLSLINTELHFRLGTGDIDETCFISSDSVNGQTLTRTGATRLLDAISKKCDGILCAEWKSVKIGHIQTKYNGEPNSSSIRTKNVNIRNEGRTSTTPASSNIQRKNYQRSSHHSHPMETDRHPQRASQHSYPMETERRPQRTTHRNYPVETDYRPQPPYNEQDQNYRPSNFKNTARHRGCYQCGELNHNQANCRYDRKIQCTSCFKYGHKSKMCDVENYH